MSKTHIKRFSAGRTSHYIKKRPKRLLVHWWNSSPLSTRGDEYRKAAVLLVGGSVVHQLDLWDSGLSGSPVMFGNSTMGMLLKSERVLGRGSHGKYIATDDANHVMFLSPEVMSKTWFEYRDRTQYPVTDHFDDLINFSRDGLRAGSEQVGANFLFSSSVVQFLDRFLMQEWSIPNTEGSSSRESDNCWVHDPNGILARLENEEAFPNDYEAAVLFAEVKPFRGEQKVRLLDALRKYIQKRRFVEDEDSLVTLCSAIRKYAMNMPESCFDEYANWLLPTETATLHHEAEMEFVKGICWRLEFEPHVWPADYPVLTKTLFDLVDSYLTPRLILQKSYANTAMFGMVALHVLEAISASNKAFVGHLRKRMMDSSVKWFVEMVDDNIDEAIQHIAERDDALAREVAKIRRG